MIVRCKVRIPARWNSILSWFVDELKCWFGNLTMRRHSIVTVTSESSEALAQEDEEVFWLREEHWTFKVILHGRLSSSRELKRHSPLIQTFVPRNDRNTKGVIANQFAEDSSRGRWSNLVGIREVMVESFACSLQAEDCHGLPSHLLCSRPCLRGIGYAQAGSQWRLKKHTSGKLNTVLKRVLPDPFRHPATIEDSYSSPSSSYQELDRGTGPRRSYLCR